VEGLLAALEGTAVAQGLRAARWGYAAVNTLHVFGIALLVGAILPLDLRLLGLFRTVPLDVLGPFLARSAALGVALAILTGLWLFSVQPAHYFSNDAFRYKLALLALALVNVALQHANRHFRMALGAGTIHPSVRALALVSIFLWLSTLLAGRWIGFL
jgi:hypothetical protein